MSANDNSTPAAPKPPDDLDGEALLEWHRIVAELHEHGLLATADRAIITHHCRTWATIQLVSRVVAVDGPVVLLPNNWPGKSKEYEVQVEQMKLDATLLASLGLTPASRAKLATKPADANDGAITF